MDTDVSMLRYAPDTPLSVFTVHWVGTNKRKYSPAQVAYW
jgi:hypothetical protein